MRGSLFVLALTPLLGGCNQSPPPPPEPSTVRPLQEWIDDLQSGDDETRLMAVLALGEMGRPAKPALPALARALKDSNRFVREKAAWSMVYVDPTGEEVLQALGAATRDPEPAVRFKVIQALGKIGAPAEPAADELVRLLKDANPRIRFEAAYTLGKIGPGVERTRVYLAQVAEFDPDDTVRTMASEALKWIDSKK
jgi:HEAT repeat protein